MTDPIDPIRAAAREDRRASARRRGDPEPGPDRHSQDRGGRQDKGGGTNLPVLSTAVATDPAPPLTGDSAFAAHLLGQKGQKRGLRGGPETLERARSAYLETEWSGPTDRRPPRGRLAKNEV